MLEVNSKGKNYYDGGNYIYKKKKKEKEITSWPGSGCERRLMWEGEV